MWGRIKMDVKSGMWSPEFKGESRVFRSRTLWGEYEGDQDNKVLKFPARFTTPVVP